MRPILTPDQMARADRLAIEAGTPGEVLMDRAGAAVAMATASVAGGRYGKRVVVVCGKGNNGGDGFVAARVLHHQGFGVICMVVFDPGEASGAARDHLERMTQAGVRAERFDARLLERSDVIVDAIFGTGFAGAARGDAAVAIRAIRDSRARVVAVDIPSGVDATTGATTEGDDGEIAVDAEVTVTMAAYKTGIATGRGAALAGRVDIANIGIDPLVVFDADLHGRRAAWNERVPGASWMLDGDDVLIPVRRVDAHKRSVGSVLVIAGSDPMPGAASMTAAAALRAGAGYVTLASTEGVCSTASARTPELVTRPVGEGILDASILDGLGDAIDRADVVVIGPGLGRGDVQHELVARAVEEIDPPLVLDADGLNAMKGDARRLSKRVGELVITPHPAELARLLDVDTSAVQADRFGAVARAAEEFEAIVLLKGFRSVVGAWDQEGGALERWVIPSGGPELATAGTGDVLSGALGAFLAGLRDHPRRAAVSAAYAHGVAGWIAARHNGGVGVTAWDVLEALPEAMAAIVKGESL